MTREEAIKMLQVARLMLMDGADQPISDLYYALDMAIEALEQIEPQTYIAEDRTQILDAWQVHHKNTTSVEDEPQTENYCTTCDHYATEDCEHGCVGYEKALPQTEREGE